MRIREQRSVGLSITQIPSFHLKDKICQIALDKCFPNYISIWTPLYLEDLTKFQSTLFQAYAYRKTAFDLKGTEGDETNSTGNVSVHIFFHLSNKVWRYDVSVKWRQLCSWTMLWIVSECVCVTVTMPNPAPRRKIIYRRSKTNTRSTYRASQEQTQYL